MKKLFSIVCLSAIVLLCSAQNKVYPLTQHNANSNSLVYYLPKSDIVVVASAEQVIEKPGPFYKYAERYLGLTNVIVRERNSWRLTGVTLETQAVKDTAKGFQVEMGNKGIVPLMSWTTEKVIRGVNFPFSLSQSAPITAVEVMNLDTAISFDLSQLGEEALMANSIPKMAEMAAKQIYRIREARATFISGENEQMPDGVALQQMLASMDQSEAELLALFVGKQVVVPSQRRFTLAIDGALNNYIVFRVSSLTGILSPDNLMGSPVYLNLRPEYVTHQTDNSKSKKVVPTGYTYNNPGWAIVTVTDNQKINVEKRLPMPQFGVVESLPISLCNDANLQIVYDEQTGAILQLAY